MVLWCHLSAHRLVKKPFPIVLPFSGIGWIVGFGALFLGSPLLLHIGELEISRWFGMNTNTSTNKQKLKNSIWGGEGE